MKQIICAIAVSFLCISTQSIANGADDTNNPPNEELERIDVNGNGFGGIGGLGGHGSGGTGGASTGSGGSGSGSQGAGTAKGAGKTQPKREKDNPEKTRVAALASVRALRTPVLGMLG